MPFKNKGDDHKDISHQKIMDIGNAIHSKTLEILEDEKQEAIKTAREETWSESKKMHEESLEEALKLAQIKYDVALRKKDKSFAEALKEQSQKLAEEINNKVKVAVEEEKEKGQLRLQMAVQETLKNCEMEKTMAVCAARSDEQETAKTRLREALCLENESSSKLLALKDKMHQAEIECQKRHMVEEMEKAMELASEQQKNLALAKEVVKDAEQKALVQLYREEIRQKDKVISTLLQEKLLILESKRKVQDELVQTREAFQKFINHSTPFEDGYADYVLPPVRTVSSKRLLMK